MKDRLTLFTKYLLDVLFYAGIVVTVTLPLGIRFMESMTVISGSTGSD